MEITAEGLDEAVEAVSDLSDRLRNLAPIMTVVAEDTRVLIDDSFESSAAPDGSAWAPLSSATVAIKPRRQNGKPLVDTGRLRQSITVEAGPRSFRFGTNVAYAGSHQLGARTRVFGRKPAAIPARPFLPVVGSGGRFGLMTTGRAGAHWRAVRDSIREYILTGRIT